MVLNKKLLAENYQNIIEHNNDILHYHTFKENHLTKKNEKTKILLLPHGSENISEMIKYTIESLGYKIHILPPEDEESQKIGKSYVTRGQCLPVVYLVGNLLKFIFQLQSQGLSKEEIIKKYAHLTLSSATGTCRLQMYEEEYRKALKEIGMEEFTIVIFNMSSKNKKTGNEYQLPREFPMKVGLGFILSDVLGDLQRKIRTYEINNGETDKIFVNIRKEIGENCGNKRKLFKSIKEARKQIEAIPVSLSQLKVKINITGEIFCSFTDSHLSSNMFRWLESEGAEVSIQLLTQYFLYNIWRSKFYRGMIFKSKKNKSLHDYLEYYFKIAAYTYSSYYLNSLYKKISKLFGNYNSKLTPIEEMIEVSKDLYDKEIFGGESFQEVAKHILCIQKKEADMVMSLKPFTCIPSIASDAIQTKVENMYGDSIFIPVEVNGDSVINMRSRIQMKLFEAKQKVNDELDDLYNEKNINKQDINKKINSLNLGLKDLKFKKKSKYASTYLNIVDQYVGK